MARRLQREQFVTAGQPSLPVDIGRVPPAVSNTQAALGRTLLDLTREAPEAAKRIITVSPDVSSSTNLAGWLNKVGVWSPHERRDWFDDGDARRVHDELDDSSPVSVPDDHEQRRGDPQEPIGHPFG